MCKGIGIRFVELPTPQLSSILRINQFHMQKQLIVAPNHFSYDDRVDKQILTNDSYIKAFVLAVPNGAVCQNPYFWCLRNRIDNPLDNSLVKELQIRIVGVARQG